MAHNYSDELEDEVFLALSKQEQERVLEAERKKREQEKLLFELKPSKDISKPFSWSEEHEF